MTGQLATNRSTSDTAASHVSDHNELHRAHNRVFDVVGYGATGDGSTDDSTAIQNAINAAVNATFSGIGATVYFPNGKYYIATGLTHTGTNYGVSFIGEGSPGMSGDDLATGCSSILVGSGIWGLKLGTANSGDYRGYTIKNLAFYDANTSTHDSAYGGLQLIDTNNSTIRDCSFGAFKKSVSTTVAAGSNGVALSAASTLNVASTTGWPSSGTGYIATNGTASGGGQKYHSFSYSAVGSSTTLTGCVFNAPTSDTISTGAAVVASVGVGVLVNGRPNGSSGECSINTFDNIRVGTCTIGYLQLGVASANRMVNCYFDGHHNDVTDVTAGSCGIRLVSGQILADGGNVQGYDTLIHICKANQENRLNFRMEGWKTTGILLEGDGGTASSMIGGFGQSNVTGKGPGLTINSGVSTAIITADINNLSPINDFGTKNRYPMQTGMPLNGPAVTGSIVGRQPVYDLTNNLIGYLPIYDSISGIYLVNGLGGVDPGTTAQGSITRTLTVGAAAGDLIVVGGGYGTATTGVTVTVTDSKSNSWTTDATADGATAGLGSTPYAFVAHSTLATALAPGDTITCTFSANVNYPKIYVFDYAGQATSSLVDVTGTATGTNSTPTKAVTTGTANDLVFAAVNFKSSTPATFSSATAPFSVPGGVGTTVPLVGGGAKTLEVLHDLNGGNAGSISAACSLSTSTDWAIAVAAFKKL